MFCNIAVLKVISIYLIKLNMFYIPFITWVMSFESINMLLKILSKIILSKLRSLDTNLVFSFCFLTYSSTDNFLSPILVSNCLIFCLGNLIPHQKKKWKWWHKFFDERQKKCHESICKCKVGFFTVNSPHWCLMQHAQNFRDTEKM